MAASTMQNRHDTHSTTANGAWTTKRIAVTALFCAATVILSFVEIPIFPPAAWLKYDPSGVICAIAGLTFGPGMGVLVSVLSWCIHFVFTGDIYGTLMAIVAMLCYVVPAALIYKANTTMRGAIVGLVAGSVLAVVACCAANIVITPLYTAVSASDVIAMIVPILLPFNLIKVAINSIVTVLVYKPVSKALGA